MIPPGKIPPDVLQRAVLSNLGVRRREVLVHAGLGEDSAVIDFGEFVAVLTTDPITGASRRAGWLGVHVCCNDLASNGAEPIGVLTTLLFPEGTTEADVARVVAEVNEAASELGIEVIGGHSEVTLGLSSLLLSVTAIGIAPKAGYVTSAGARPGHYIIVTKGVAIEGTAVLATDFEDELAVCLMEGDVRSAQGLYSRISVVRDGLVAARHGASALHDVTEGGIVGALYELAEASGVGMDVRAEDIPILPETDTVCRHYGIDPLRLIASGAMLVAAPDGEAMLAHLEREGIPATVIGRATEAGRRLIFGDHTEDIKPPERDELWRVLEKKERA